MLTTYMRGNLRIMTWGPVITKFLNDFSFPSLVPLTLQNPLISVIIVVMHGWDHVPTSPDLPASSVFQGKCAVRDYAFWCRRSPLTACLVIAFLTMLGSHRLIAILVLGKIINVSKLQSSYLWNGNKGNMDLLCLLWGLNKIIEQ